MGLKEFADQQPSKTSCKTCNLEPELRQEIEQGMKEGVAGSVAARYLATLGIKVDGNNILRHMRNHV